MRPALAPYLRSLWNVAPALLDIPVHQAGRPFLSPLGLHLPTQAPAGAAGNWFQAAAAHAAAHLVFSQHRFDPAGLGPVPQALLGTLEDARVEWLTCRELPGLRRLWLPFHAGEISDTPNFEDLLRRLSRSLLDSQYRDPHPWVRKGRGLFFLDDACDMLALTQPQALRQAASRLGNDIGQMRLQFNARLYQVAPAYRDDNSCLWLADPQRADTTHDVASGPQGHGAASGQALAAPAAQLHHYPEWDRRVPMYRPDWCAVLDAPARAAAPGAGSAALDSQRTGLVVPGPRIRLNRQLDGDEFDLDALVQAWVARRSGEALEPRVHRRTPRAAHAGDTLLLIDASASTAQPFRGSDASVLSATRSAALLYAQAIQHAAGACAIHSFCSEGRHAVHYERVKDFDEALDTRSVARLMGLRSRLSTRLGAALRHATRLITARRGIRRILLLTDGKPQDIDVHDPHYLVEDARQAVREAARRGIQIQCLTLDRQALGPLGRVFGPGQVHALTSLAALPAALSRLALNARQ